MVQFVSSAGMAEAANAQRISRVSGDLMRDIDMSFQTNPL